MRNEKLCELSGVSDNSVVIFGEDFNYKNGATVELIEDRFSRRIEQSISYASSDLKEERIISENEDINLMNWLEGLPCQVLQPGKKWQEGKIRLRVIAEFVPNDSETGMESILDDIRNSIELT
jgi:KGK domain